jgi:hypothetical protein
VIEEVAIEVTLPTPVSFEKAKQVPAITEKHFVIPDGMVDDTQEIHPDVIPEGSKCSGSEVSYLLKFISARLTAKKIVL